MPDVQIFSKCKYEMSDTPRDWVPMNHWWNWYLMFLGVMHDRCNNWVPRRVKMFDASSTGLTNYPSRVTHQPR